MSTGGRRSSASGDKRESILHAAWALIRHYGFAKTTIDDIARKALVGKGTVYLYFRSKTDIMLALTDLTNERISREVERIASGPGAAEERIKACVSHRIMTLYDLVRRYPHSEDVIASMLPEIVKRLDGYVRRHGQVLAQIVAQGCAAGTLECQDPAATGQLLASLFEFMTPPYYRFKSRSALEKFVDQVADLVLRGLQPRPHGPDGADVRPTTVQKGRRA